MAFCKKCGKVIVDPYNCSTRYSERIFGEGAKKKFLQAVARFRRSLCAVCYKKKITPLEKRQDEADVARWEAE